MYEEGFMLAVLKGIPLIRDIKTEGNSRFWIMTIDGHPARGELFSEAFSISLFLNDLESLPKPCLAYVTLLLAAHPDIHDYAIQLTTDGGWLNSYYTTSSDAELIAIEIEKHLALTCVLKNVIRNRHKLYSGGL
ncbi:SPI-2 type III secretion system protein SpiC [Salmonella enterica subsp. diarizonae serovar 50:z52:z35]|uniref:SPI-2 type III secretion system protein SpiC n=1 Tax=Salmonella diarizonae TaxID=59204 RepID=A0A627X1T3_SALDZ|nr:SPI-2 type III secretion system protein SpiC [Salmonella enterica subsp. diarizonae]EDR8620016.1 SPI-2 type III secretion system protein SpiC [Salmonella enterica]EHN1754062.1 SPI-2 type III secretion system protein SpiC [Salmonella enterica subsp. diarizonae serovar 50:z52:z35]HAB4049127.1 SPI-2 type III secretion system protein SpiC [Salmonella enterica subsp. diarizonae]